MHEQKIEPSPQYKTSLQQPHAPIISAAAKALIDREIPLMEYGSQVEWRYGYPLVLMLVEWAVPDTLLPLASQTLSGQGIPCVPPSTSISTRFGQWERAGFIHNLDLLGRSRIYLYPLSFVGLALQDTVEVSSTFNFTLRVLTPKPRMYMVSLIRHLLDCPIGNSSKIQVQDSLLGFISSYILHDTPINTKDGEDDDDESEGDYEQRVEEAVQNMRSWDWDTTEEGYLKIAERLVRDCPSIWDLPS